MKKSILLLLSVGLVACFLVSALAQQWVYVGVITSDAARGEHCLLIEIGKTVQVGKPLLIESRDGAIRETYVVRHVYDHNVILEQMLKSDYVSGSRIYQ